MLMTPVTLRSSTIRLARAGAALALMTILAVGPGFSATPPPVTSVTLLSHGETAVVTMAEIARLPHVTVTVSFGTEHGKAGGVFQGPLLWLLLTQRGAVDPKKPRQEVTGTVVVTGRDGYAAVLALGEIGPDFENKPVILADQMDGKPLGALRLVVPIDRRGGRNVRDVSTIAVTTGK